MQWMLALSRLIDAVNAIIGRSVSWIVLVVVLISAGNAIIRKLVNQRAKLTRQPGISALNFDHPG